MPNILITSEVDVEKIVHDKKKARGKGAHQNCRVSYGTHRDFVIQGPKMRVPFGVSEPKPEYNPTGLDKFSFELSLQTDPKYDTKGQVAEFKDLLEKMDETKFNPYERKNGEAMTEIEKMDQGFDGKTYTINGIEGDFS